MEITLFTDCVFRFTFEKTPGKFNLFTRNFNQFFKWMTIEYSINKVLVKIFIYGKLFKIISL